MSPGHFISSVIQSSPINRCSLVAFPITNFRNILKATNASLQAFINSWVPTFATLVGSKMWMN